MISLMESLELELGPDSLEPYLSPEESKSIKPVNSFTREGFRLLFGRESCYRNCNTFW